MKPVIASSNLNSFAEVNVTISYGVFESSEIVFNGVEDGILMNVEDTACVEIKPTICKLNLNVFEGVGIGKN